MASIVGASGSEASSSTTLTQASIGASSNAAYATPLQMFQERTT
jgi:hypothetical protein